MLEQTLEALTVAIVEHNKELRAFRKEIECLRGVMSARPTQVVAPEVKAEPRFEADAAEAKHAQAVEAQPEQTKVAQTVEEKPEVTFDSVKALCMQVQKAHGSVAVIEALQVFGVRKLTEVPPAKLAEFDEFIRHRFSM